jgi:hypothetical protein
MKRLFTTVLILAPALLFAQYGEYQSNKGLETESLILIIVGAAINLLIIWGIVNHATRADRLLKSHLTIIAHLQKLSAEKGLPAVTNHEISVLNKHLKSINLDIEYPAPKAEEIASFKEMFQPPTNEAK